LENEDMKNYQISIKKTLPRHQYLQVVRAALLSKSYRYAQDTVLKWLSSYPGDLKAGLYYAQALLGLGRNYQAISILEGLCEADPEFKAAAETFLFSISSPNEKISLNSDQLSLLFILTNERTGLQSLAPWGKSLYKARLALQRRDYEKANQFINRVFELGGENPLAAVTHLRILSSKEKEAYKEIREQANQYRQRWPDCLACTLIYCDALMQAGDTDLAVALIHQAAGRDVGGQVAESLWGIDHQYRSLWPDLMERKLDKPIPGEVASTLGLNRLTVGRSDNTLVSDASEADHLSDQPVEVVPDLKDEEDRVDIFKEEKGRQISLTDSPSMNSQENGDNPPKEIETESIDPISEPVNLPKQNRSQGVDKDLSSVAEAFERIAQKVNLPGVTHLDGRFPVYVVFSLRNRLESVYGEKMANILDAEMWRLVEAVRDRPGWGARLYFADDALCTNPLGIQPVKSGDPWELKLALRDLDAALSKRGEQIGALLIVGGPEIVPFHKLPNPIDDQDDDVPSDNPYATRDENYFLPEWPVGRLPGGDGNDARLLLGAMRRISTYHSSLGRRRTWFYSWKRLWDRCLDYLQGNKRGNFGYTAAVWHKAASNVFQIIGKVEDLYVSPPLGLNGSGEELASADQNSPKGGVGIPSLNGPLGYFNLHGLVDAPEWYGQADPFCSTDGPDYPVAIRPEDLDNQKNGQIPKIVLSEACYGLHIMGRSVDQAMSLKFLQVGSLAVIGSTCMAYGSIGKPLIAADYLSSSFWRFLREGMPAGEALRQAKIRLADVMNKRQGYLDVEDQKTLISFCLYGDPLAQSVIKRRSPKVVRYLDKPLPGIDTMSEDGEFVVLAQPMPADVMSSVKQVVKQYLPGMSDANVSYSCDNELHNDEKKHVAHSADNYYHRSDNSSEQLKSNRQVVTLSKEITRSEGTHPIYARLTLDDDGELVKLVVSR
jgi:tetratricopeptide (TPR) repeat protein